ncbi:TonB-dependent receptor [Weeksellaceae bacterium TAE3-ERU29]|nr:TonB-dependent receptor [Weeksellaceae bacterium TAE3-ERU29]
MYKKIFSLGLLGSALLAMAQEQKPQVQDTIELSSVQVIAELPVTNEIVTKKQIESKNLGQDMPFLLKNTTGVVVTSDAGAGVGYTNLRLRGIGSDQINVTFNGVPVNDSESQGVYWVDFPDISSTTGGVVIQRGVGTSSNGATSFGGSVNLDTNKRKTKAFGDMMATYGSFNTQKYMLTGGTGDIGGGKFNFDARQSYVKSDGYIDRGTSKLYSTALNARYMPSQNTEIHLMNIFGYERTYQSWNGVSESEIKQYGRKFNNAGVIYGESGDIIDYYKDEVDNYTQNHTHLYWSQKYDNNWVSKVTLHYTKGFGYYQNYDGWVTNKDGLKNYGIDAGKLSDLDGGNLAVMARRWLDNDFFGGIFNIENTQLGNTKLYAGIAANKYVGNHYGNVIGVEKVVGNKRVEIDSYINDGDFYTNQANKSEVSSFVKILHKLGDFELFGDVQTRHINYVGEPGSGRDPWDSAPYKPFNLTYDFINPKAGINYKINYFSKVYFSYGLAHREPKRKDILNSSAVKPEVLHDFELGYKLQKSNIQLAFNTYYMRYKNQLVFTGKLDNVGAALRENVGDSYRTGIEFNVDVKALSNLDLFGNMAWSVNKNIDYYQKEDGKQVFYGNTDISFSPNIISSFGVNYIPIKDFNINLVNKYVSSQYVTNTENKSLMLDPYFVSDILANYNIDLGKQKIELSLLFNNIFDKEYANNGSGKIKGGKPKMKFYPQAGRNFLAGVKFRF